MRFFGDNTRAAVMALTGAVVLGLATLGLQATAADAAPREGENDYYLCYTHDQNGATGIYFHGEEITVTDEDGKTRKFRCNGNTGQWEEVARIIGGATVNILHVGTQAQSR
ncbi:MAG TPA: hypothetical protein VJB57_19475 [Dehalococcoidia bacterium]|nr:hypothetical protein [Dehalococcoidia bacterium]